jgi:hypothetical protein
MVMAVLLLVSSACSGEPGRIEGTVTAGPTCPVEREGEPCEDRPVSGASVIVSDEDGKDVAEATTDQDGRFSITIKPGTWNVTARTEKAMSCDGQLVEVTEADDAEVDISCDTGIR